MTETPVYSHGRPTVRGLGGMVTSAHPLATMAGVEMLQAGGNAFDAIVATAATLNVVEPYMSGLSGLGLATVHTADGRVRVLSFHPPVPGAFDAEGLVQEDITTGPKAPATPGNLAGWCTLARECGTMGLDRLFAPAIRHARDGFATTVFFQQMTAGAAGRAMQPEWKSLYVDGTAGGLADRVFRQPDLAETLTAIASEGPGYLYDGPLGAKMVDHVASLGGFLTRDDLAAVEPIWEEPVHTRFAGLDVHVPPPPEGSFQVLLTLRMLETAGLSPEHLSADHLDRLFRAVRVAAEARIRNWRATTDEVDRMLSDEHIARLVEQIDEPGATNGRTEGYGRGPLPALAEMRQHTTSFSAVDGKGNAVCLTQTLGSPYGSGVVIPGTGVCMNNFLNWGDLDPASSNPLTGGDRYGTCLAPSISLDDGAFVLALGTPGSYGIFQTQVQAMVHRFTYGLELQAAIDAPRGRLWDGDRIELENRIEPGVVDELRARGHGIETIPAFSMKCGGMHAIARDPSTGILSGAADSRRDGAAIAL